MALARNWNSLVIPPYHMNQFGGTLGLPILKNKLFYFGDIQDTRIAYAATNTYTAPTALMRQGNFTELLNTSLTGQAKPIQLYQPNSGGGAGGTAKLSCNGVNNVFCPSQIDPVARNLLSLYPMPNANGGKTFNNLVENLATDSDPVQWDQRLDWNISEKDQAYVRYSYQHTMNRNTPPLGPVLDGTGNFVGSQDSYLTQNFMLSETHIFNPNLTNEFRFSFNWGKFLNLQENYNVNVAASLGLGGMPFGSGYPDNGGLPQVSVGNITGFGTHGNDPSVEGQNVYQILDNVTKISGNHSLRAGVDFQNLRIRFLQPPTPRGAYGYTGLYTGIPGQSFTGYGVADFLANQMNSASITNEPVLNDEQGYSSAYVEDNWRVTSKLTVDVGLRYDYFQPYEETAGLQANFPLNFSRNRHGSRNLLDSSDKAIHCASSRIYQPPAAGQYRSSIQSQCTLGIQPKNKFRAPAWLCIPVRLQDCCTWRLWHLLRSDTKCRICWKHRRKLSLCRPFGSCDAKLQCK